MHLRGTSSRCDGHLPAAALVGQRNRSRAQQRGEGVNISVERPAWCAQITGIKTGTAECEVEVEPKFTPLKMAERESVRSSQEKDLRYNVEVAKKMTVPDEIRLTGPSRAAVDLSKPSSSASQSNYHLSTQQLAPTAPDLETNQDRPPPDKNE